MQEDQTYFFFGYSAKGSVIILNNYNYHKTYI